MKGSWHAARGRSVARRVGKQELRKLGKEWSVGWDLVAQIIGDNAGRLPDFLEPALGPDHRSIFHSKDLHRELEMVRRAIRAKNNADDPNWKFNIVVLMALAAYQSHFEGDEMTPMGVPDIFWITDLVLKLMDMQ